MTCQTFFGSSNKGKICKKIWEEGEREGERKKERKKKNLCERERGGEWLRLNINREDVKSWETFKYSFFDFSPN